MSLTKTVGFFAVTTLAVGGAAFGAEQNNDMQAQIADLQAQVAALKGAQSGQWLTEQRAAEIRGIVTDVLADADTRSSLAGPSAGAGYNGGFFLSSADGNYSMKINVLEQIRWSFNNTDTSTTDTIQPYGFENKRTRLTFSGNMVDSTWSYKLAYYLGYSNSAENFGAGELADAFVAKDLGNGLSVTVGQFKLPFSAEYGIDVGNLQFSDYSVANTVLGTGYGQGLMLGYAADQIRAGVAYTNSQNQVNQNWDANSPSDDWALTGRGEFKIAGDWGQFNDAQSWKGEGFGALVGVGYATARENGANNDPWKLTIDGTVDFGGANLTGAYYWTDLDNGSNQQPGGYTLAGGVFLTDTFELVARWDSIDPDNGGDNITSWTFGGNCYFAKNTAKCGVELGYAPNAIPAGAEYANWVDSNGQDGEWVIRVQMSFSF